MNNTSTIILSAGSSKRMGTPKQLLPYKHTTLLGWTIEQAKNSTSNEVVCVLGANAEAIKKSIKNYQIKTIFNPNFKDGLSSSIVAGIQYLSETETERVLVLLADQPNITSDYLNELIKTSKENPSKIIASNYGKHIGVPAVFPKYYSSELLKLKGDKGAKVFLNKNVSNILVLKKMINLVDIDTKEDYQKLIN